MSIYDLEQNEVSKFHRDGLMRTEFFVHKSLRWANFQESQKHGSLLPPKIFDWLEDEIGIRRLDWEWDLQNARFYFTREEDKVKFILRWI